MTTPYRTASRPCPRCQQPLESSAAARICRACGGRWLEESTLAELLGQMTGQPTRPTFWPRGGLRELFCPVCTVRMVPVSLEGVPIDRCPDGHGVWFDADELQAALHATERPAEEAPRRDPGKPWDITDLLDVIVSIVVTVAIAVIV